MWGSIIGDLAGSIYEYSQIKEVSPIVVDELIKEESFYSDDTILTVAVLDAILNDQDYCKYLKEYGKRFISYRPDVTPYFKTSFSPGFIKWLKSDEVGCSMGNGAMMRIAPVGFMFDDLEKVSAMLFYTGNINKRWGVFGLATTPLINLGIKKWNEIAKKRKEKKAGNDLSYKR